MDCNKIHNKPSEPDKYSTENISRRSFLERMAVGSVIIALPLQIKSSNSKSFYDLSTKQLKILNSVQSILFPSDGNGPGAHDVMADSYLQLVLNSKLIDPEERNYIINGIGWVDETAVEEFSNSYVDLSQIQKEKLIESISAEIWGRSWLGVIINFIIEALLSDPIYGSNNDEIGWKWLKHNAGFPRPTKELAYPEILTTVDNNNNNVR